MPALSAAPDDAGYPLLAPRASDVNLDVTADQRKLVIVACVYAVAIVFLWNVPYLKLIIYPFKLLTVALHEFGHAAVGVCTGAKIESISLEPNEGGATRMRGGIPWLTLPAGYLGSSLFGAAMMACSFDIRAAKVMTIVLAPVFLLTLWWARRDWLTWVLLLCMAGLIVGFWFIANGIALQYLILFIGVMSSLYSLWDTLEDLVFRRVNESDASAFSRVVGCCPPQVWGVVWFLIALGFFAAGVILGLLFFKTPLQQQREANFLPTRRGLVLDAWSDGGAGVAVPKWAR